MTGFTLPRDNNSDIVQALSPVDNVTQSVSNGGQVRFTIPALTEIIRIASEVTCYIKFGDSGVVATSSDILFPVGAEVFSIKARGYTHVSILGAGATPGPASITKMV
jgi:hypothetical protein